MAEETLKRLLDDIDGEPAGETVRFGLDGVAYEIDLTNGNATKLRDALTPFVKNARRKSTRTRSRNRDRRTT